MFSIREQLFATQTTCFFIAVSVCMMLALDVDKLPDTPDAASRISMLLTNGDPNSMCETCGEVFQAVDDIQRGYQSPFYPLSLDPFQKKNHLLLLGCNADPNRRGCDTLLEKLKEHNIHRARETLQEAAERVDKLRLNSSAEVFLRNFQEVGQRYLLRGLCWTNNDRGAACFKPRSISATADKIDESRVVFSSSTSALATITLGHPYKALKWYLRYPLNTLHVKFCQPVCEGQLSITERAKLQFWRFYMNYNVEQLVSTVQETERGTVMVFVAIAMLVSVLLHRYSLNMQYISSKLKNTHPSTTITHDNGINGPSSPSSAVRDGASNGVKLSKSVRSNGRRK